MSPEVTRCHTAPSEPLTQSTREAELWSPGPQLLTPPKNGLGIHHSPLGPISVLKMLPGKRGGVYS